MYSYNTIVIVYFERKTPVVIPTAAVIRELFFKAFKKKKKHYIFLTLCK